MAELDYKPIRWFGKAFDYIKAYHNGQIDARSLCFIKDTGQVIQDNVDYGQGVPVVRAYPGYQTVNLALFSKHLKAWTACVVETSGGARYVGAFYAESVTAVKVRWMNEQCELIESVMTMDMEMSDVWSERAIDMDFVLREGESSHELWEQLADKAGNDVESVAVQYITADGMMWKGTWYPMQGFLDVHKMDGVYRISFDDEVGGLDDATLIRTVTTEDVNIGSKAQSSLNVTLDGKALIEISLTSSGNALAFTGSLPAGSSTKIVIKNTSSSSRSFNFASTSSITSLLSSTSVTVPAYKAVVLEILSNGVSMVLYQLA